MGTKRCCVPNCTPNSWPEDDGVETTYHKFPQRLEFRKNWISAIKANIDASLQPSSSNLVCSKHFKRSEWQEIKGGKLLLKQGIIPSVFGHNIKEFPKEELGKPEITGNSNVSVRDEEEVGNKKDEKKSKNEDKKLSRKSARKSILSLTPPKSSKKVKKEVKSEETDTVTEKDKVEKSEKAPEVQVKEEIKTEEVKPEEKLEKEKKPQPKPGASKDESKSSTKFSIKLPFRSKKDRKRSKEKRRPHRGILTLSKRNQKRKLTQSIQKSKIKTPTKNTSNILSPKKNLSSSINFSIGTKLDAQDFEGGWHEATIVEVDSDEGEVLIHFIKNEKQKSAVTLTDEWIPMDSCRLRPMQVVKKSEGFAIGEKCMARWNDSRKFPATVQRLVEDGE